MNFRWDQTCNSLTVSMSLVLSRFLLLGTGVMRALRLGSCELYKKLKYELENIKSLCLGKLGCWSGYSFCIVIVTVTKKCDTCSFKFPFMAIKNKKTTKQKSNLQSFPFLLLSHYYLSL